MDIPTTIHTLTDIRMRIHTAAFTTAADGVMDGTIMISMEGSAVVSSMAAADSMGAAVDSMVVAVDSMVVAVAGSTAAVVDSMVVATGADAAKR